ncbi:hypothetical protein NDU88_007714 [Pleurodeles waltl]|uniref:Uncharacterized protein n=1 Tax=Pleurodeles waltl TaxID=8319 RepID=A0AAV7STA7_PLEWA|nr:hypothetical protein NDU88_007714 [Pleurodeles waltl]
MPQARPGPRCSVPSPGDLHRPHQAFHWLPADPGPHGGQGGENLLQGAKSRRQAVAVPQCLWPAPIRKRHRETPLSSEVNPQKWGIVKATHLGRRPAKLGVPNVTGIPGSGKDLAWMVGAH